MRRGTCSVCGAGLYAGSSVCTQCKEANIGFHSHSFMRVRSCKEVLLFPLALLILLVLLVLFLAGCGLVALISNA